MTNRHAAICLLAVLAAGCGGGSLEPAPCESGHCATQLSTRKTVQATFNRALDVLFVVDDTPAIAPYAASLPTRFSEMAQALSSTRLPLSLHAAFIRSGSCDAAERAGACGVAPPDQFLRAEWCETITNDTLGIADTFACLGDLGAAGCGPAQPLSAALQQLANPPRAGWERFLRPDAYLFIIVVAAEDDASGPAGSPTAVRDIAAGLKALKADPSQVLASVISPEACPTGAVPTPRLDEFAAEFGANGLLESICDATFTSAIRRVTDDIGISIDPPCLTNVRDTDLQTPGLQADCTAVSVSRNPDGSETQSVLRTCDASAPPCLRIGPTTCNNGGNRAGWVFGIDQPTDWCIEAGINVTIECLGCADGNDPACAIQTQ